MGNLLRKSVAVVVNIRPALRLWLELEIAPPRCKTILRVGKKTNFTFIWGKTISTRFKHKLLFAYTHIHTSLSLTHTHALTYKHTHAYKHNHKHTHTHEHTHTNTHTRTHVACHIVEM